MFLERLHEGPAQMGSLYGRASHTHTHTHLANDITAYRKADRNVTEKGEALWRRGKETGGEGKGGEEEEERAWPGKSPALPLTGMGQSEAGKSYTDEVNRK